MGEGREVVIGATTSKKDKPETLILEGKHKEMTFDELKDKAWRESEKTLNNWKSRLESFVGARIAAIHQHMKDLYALYGKPPPEKPITVGLHYFPAQDRERGEPAKDLKEARRIDRDMGDVLFWVSETTVLPKDTQRDVDNRTAESVSVILHEEQHAKLQDTQFQELITQAEKDPRVASVKEKLSSTQKHYIETTNELITSYLASYSARVLKVAPTGESQESPIIFKVNRADCDTVLEAVIKTDVEEWNQNGPYTALRKAWEARFGTLPEGYQSTSVKKTRVPTESEMQADSSVYEVARSLDTELIERYIKKEKQIDVDFVAEVYQMVKAKLDKTPS